MTDIWQKGIIHAYCPKCGKLNHYTTVKENLFIRCYATHCKHCRWGHVVVLDSVACLACNPNNTSCMTEDGRVQASETSVL